MKLHFVIFFLMWWAKPIHYPIEIIFQNGSAKETEVNAQMNRIIDQNYSAIEKWFFTRTKSIDENSIPHSHPVLTVNCNYINDDLKRLSILLHGEFHRYVGKIPHQIAGPMEELRQLFPAVSIQHDGGAKDINSTYGHLIVCLLEFWTMTKKTGEEKASQIMREWKLYTWIYAKILSEKKIREILTKKILLCLNEKISDEIYCKQFFSYMPSRNFKFLERLKPKIIETPTIIAPHSSVVYRKYGK